MLSQVIQLKKKTGAYRRKIGRSTLPAILYAILLITIGCTGLQPKSSDPANVNKPLTTENDGFITSINGERFKDENERYEGGYRVEIEGTFPDPSTNGFIVVKSDRQDYYIVQPRVVRTTRTSWIGQALLGEPEKGIGESFTIFAVFTPDTFEEGQKLERAPEGIKSATIKYRRIRN
jgi:hypothetical protein